MAEYVEKFIVFHEKELKHLTDEGRDNFSAIMKAIQLGRIHEGKTPLNNYYVCNQDEPYAQKVIDIILAGEDEKLSFPVGAQVSDDFCVTSLDEFVKKYLPESELIIVKKEHLEKVKKYIAELTGAWQYESKNSR